MRVRNLLLTLLVLLSSLSFGQTLIYTRVVRGNLFLPPGTPAANSKMRFSLKYCSGQTGRVPVNPGNPPGPTGIVVSFEPFDVNVASDGSWQTQIYGNDQIICGTDMTGPSRWMIQPVFNGAAGTGIEYQIQSCGAASPCQPFSPDSAPRCTLTVVTDCSLQGGPGPDQPDTTVTINAVMAVPNAYNFGNVLLPPANGTVINFMQNGNQAGAYLAGNGNASNCLSGTGTWVACGGGTGGAITGATANRGLVQTGTTLGLITCSTNQYLSWSGSSWVCTTLTGGGGGTLPTIPQYNLYGSNGSGGAQDSGIKAGLPGFLMTEVTLATGDVSSAPAPFQLFPNASVEYFPSGYTWSGGTSGAAHGLAMYMSHSSASTSAGNGGIALGGGNSGGAGNQVYVDCETTGCDFKVPLTVNGTAPGGGGGGATLPTTPLYDLFASNSSGAAQASGVLGTSGFLRASVLEATGTGSASPWGVPNGSIEYFPTGGYGAGGANGVALHVSHSSSATGFGGIALAGGNTSGTDQLYLDCEGPPVVPALGCDFKVPVTYNGGSIGGGGGVASINGVAGAFNFTGAVSCASTTCNFTGTGGGGSGIVASGTGNYFAWYSSTGTTVNSNPNLSDNGALISSQEPLAAPGINVTGSGGIAMTGAGGTLPNPASGQGGIGIGPGNVPEFYSNGGAWTAIGTGGTGGGTAVSINGTSAGSALNITGTAPLTFTLASGTATASITGTGSATDCLLGTGVFGFCPTGGGGTVSNPIVFPGATLTNPATGSGGFGVMGTGTPAMSINGGTFLPILQPRVNGSGITPGPTNPYFNFNATTPAAPAYGVNLTWQMASGTGSISAYLAGDGSLNCLSGQGTYVNCGGGLSTIPNPILSSAGTTLTPVTGQGGIGIATGGVPEISINGAAYAPIGTGTVSANSGNVGAIAYYAAAGASTTVAPSTIAVATSNGLNVGSGVVQFGSGLTAAPDTGIQRLAANYLSLGSQSGGEGSYLRSANSCAVTAPVSFSSTVGTGICSRTLLANRAWIVHCVIPWTWTAGSGSATVIVGLTLSGIPTTTSYFSTILAGAAGPVYGTTLLSTNGNVPLITSTPLTISTTTVFSAYIDGVINVGATNSTVSFYATTDSGTGSMLAGASCRIE